MLTTELIDLGYQPNQICSCANKSILFATDSVLSLQGIVMSSQIIKQENTESGGEDYLTEELAIAALVLSVWEDASEKLKTEFFKYIRVGISPSLTGVQNILEDGNSIFRNLTNSIKNDVLNEIKTIITKGSKLVTGFEQQGTLLSTLDKVKSRELVEEGTLRQIQYYADSYYERFIKQRLLDKITKELAGLSPIEFPSNTKISTISKLIEDTLDASSYTRLVSGIASNRAYVWGTLKASQLAGFTLYQYVAIIDERTTDICRYLNGRVFSVASALNLLDKVMQADPGEEVDLMPFPKFEDMKDLDTAELAKNGWLTPGLHAYCRSIVIPI